MNEATYRNPIARDGDFADPFVLRHDGRYYLYATNPDVRCWSSDDLLHWRAEGPTIAADAFPGLVPFAPEVVYSDGAFFMYTSPSGHGHVVLRSEGPTGPFVAVTGNVEHAIDGNVFVDDDGRRYFYWAGDEGIWGCKMPSPTEFGEPVFTGIHMNGWTEGPFVSKRDGVYQMTLTGNHYLSRGYRIDAASSAHPLEGYRPAVLNPVLVGADGPATGLGHSSTVVGPDLVSTWIVYHNLNPDASRDLDIDRQVGTGRSLMVLGPTTSAAAPVAPSLAWSGGGFSPAVEEPFTAELNLTPSADVARYGIALGALTVAVEAEAHQVRASGGGVDATAALPRGFAHEALHCWWVEWDGARLRVRLDGRTQLDTPFVLDAAVRLTSFCDGGELLVGRCALNAGTPEAADRAAVKPVPGRFWAAGGEEGERLTRGAEIDHRLHVQWPGPARVRLAGEFSPGDEFAVELDGESLPVRLDARSGLVSVDVVLPADDGRLVLRGIAGRPLVRLVTVDAAGPDEVGEFPDEQISGWGKRLLGQGRWDDLHLSCRVATEFAAEPGHADLLIRASQLAEGGEGADTRLGIDFLLGYSVQLHPGRIVLARHDYDTTVLAAAPIEPAGGLRELAVSVVADEFRIELDGREAIRAWDELPHTAGAVGLRTANAELRVSALRVVPIRRPDH
ncbi:MAG: glycoside hydrolase family 43 protein [Protaetiibacter sp.]